MLLPSDMLPTAYEGGPVWHYTTVAGFEGIITSGSLRATGVGYLNDSREISYGAEIMSRAWPLVAPRFSPVVADLMDIAIRNALSFATHLFVACASTRRDDLSQWRGYGGGYAIGLDPSASLSVRGLERISRDPAEYYEAYPLAWRQVIYNPQDQINLCARVLEIVATGIEEPLSYAYREDGRVEPWDVLISAQHELIQTALALVKDPAFANENEVRVIARIPHGHAPFFRAGQYSVVPFVLVKGTEPEARLPVSEVLVGPSPEGKMAAAGARALMRSLGYRGTWTAGGSEAPDVPVSTSGIPLRT